MIKLKKNMIKLVYIGTRLIIGFAHHIRDYIITRITMITVYCKNYKYFILFNQIWSKEPDKKNEVNKRLQTKL